MKVKARPCRSCPYRRDVPVGVWDGSEYDKLEAYDAETGDQPLAVFCCHTSPEEVCSGWAGVDRPPERALLALRLAVITGRLDPSALDYVSPIALFGSDREAAEHGRSGIASPPAEATELIRKLSKIPRLRDAENTRRRQSKREKPDR